MFSLHVLRTFLPHTSDTERTELEYNCSRIAEDDERRSRDPGILTAEISEGKGTRSSISLCVFFELFDSFPVPLQQFRLTKHFYVYIPALQSTILRILRTLSQTYENALCIV